MTYLADHPESDRRAIVRGATAGLTYLHGRQITHGDIRACNILIEELHDSSGWHPQARISDFGLAACSSTNPEILYHGMVSAQKSTYLRYLSPERCQPGNKPFPTLSSDVFCFAGTIYEIMTGRKPFYEENEPGMVVVMIHQGQLPTRPADQTTIERGLNRGVWLLLLDMWAYRPEDRANMTVVSEELRNIM